MSIPVISVQSGYAQNSEFANQFPSANSGQGSGIGSQFPSANSGQEQNGNPINSLPPTQLRSSSPECTKEVDAHKKLLESIVRKGRLVYSGVAADNLARFMEGKGGVKYIDSEWLRSFDKVKDIQNYLYRHIQSQVEQVAPTLADGDSRTFSYKLYPQIVFDRKFHFSELFWATGSSTIKVSIQLDLTRDGDIVQAHADLFLDWSDRYDWDAFKSVWLPTIGTIYDRTNEMQEVCKGAKPFIQKSSWKLNFDTNVKVAESVGGETDLLGDNEQACKGIVGERGDLCQ